MTEEEKIIVSLIERVRGLEVELGSADKALKLAEKAVESKWGHALAIFATVISIVTLILQLKR